MNENIFEYYARCSDELKRIAKECADANPEKRDVFIRLNEALALELLKWIEQWPQ